MDDFVKKAFEKAEDEAVLAEEILGRIDAHLDEKMPYLLEFFSQAIGKEKAMKFALLNGGMTEVLTHISTIFFLGGYASALDDVKNGEIKP